jgi:lysophospholipase L1-like esterase
VTNADLGFLVLGDSYSIGEGVAGRDRWPAQLAMSLRRHGDAIDDPRYNAVTGWTTGELSAGIDAVEAGETPLSPPYRLVTLQIGVNDQYRGRPVADFRPEFTQLLERAIGYAGGDASHVLVLSIPDWGRTPFARAQGRDAAQVTRELDEYNAATAEICAAHGVPWIDITDFTRRPEGGNAVVDDGLHPSPEMYALWVERILGSE